MSPRQPSGTGVAAENVHPAPAGDSMETLIRKWQQAWPAAVHHWGEFVRLSPPHYCRDEESLAREGLSGSFAMIRLIDHAVVIGAAEADNLGLHDLGEAILAHEVGHHVYVPGDLADQARMLARMRRALPGLEDTAPFVANLYADLLVNDRLQRRHGLPLVDVYRKVVLKQNPPLWRMYLRTYELLWSLPRQSLAGPGIESREEADAGLAARLVRVYAREWLAGSGRFAALCLPYLEGKQVHELRAVLRPLLDTENCGAGGRIPDGLAGMDDGEEEGALHPVHDPRLNDTEGEGENQTGPGPGEADSGGRKNEWRDPAEYIEVMNSLGVVLDKQELIARYYRERALPHVIRWPGRVLPRVVEPQPEGTRIWDPGNPLHRIDWPATLAAGPLVIPGVTTRERVMGEAPGTEPQRQPADLYIGIDCSGSMPNPAANLSWPSLAGVILALSAIRGGGRVRVCLSGEPGKFNDMNSFQRDEKQILQTLTSYLGTGYSYGIERLHDAFPQADPQDRLSLVVVITDSDIFHMLAHHPRGWQIAEESLAHAGGGGVMVLHRVSPTIPGLDRLRQIGWEIHLISDWSDVVTFARAFARRHWEENRK